MSDNPTQGQARREDVAASIGPDDMGTIRVYGQEYKVYLSAMEYNAVRGGGAVSGKRRFVLIEI